MLIPAGPCMQSRCQELNRALYTSPCTYLRPVCSVPQRRKDATHASLPLRPCRHVLRSGYSNTLKDGRQQAQVKDQRSYSACKVSTLALHGGLAVSHSVTGEQVMHDSLDWAGSLPRSTGGPQPCVHAVHEAAGARARRCTARWMPRAAAARAPAWTRSSLSSRARGCPTLVHPLLFQRSPGCAAHVSLLDALSP